MIVRKKPVNDIQGHVDVLSDGTIVLIGLADWVDSLCRLTPCQISLAENVVHIRRDDCFGHFANLKLTRQNWHEVNGVCQADVTNCRKQTIQVCACISGEDQKIPQKFLASEFLSRITDGMKLCFYWICAKENQLKRWEKKSWDVRKKS